jgi:membrane-bound ClpP family serine protease
MRIDELPWLDGNAAVLLLFCGMMLVYWELCRPGAAVPGALGLGMAVVATARLWRPGAAPAPWLAMALFLIWLAITAVLTAGAIRGYLAKREFV